MEYLIQQSALDRLSRIHDEMSTISQGGSPTLWRYGWLWHP